jgi:hypothetical protein
MNMSLKRHHLCNRRERGKRRDGEREARNRGGRNSERGEEGERVRLSVCERERERGRGREGEREGERGRESVSE